MRKAILATLALSPVMLHAQANSPAQPKATLESRLAAPAAFGAAGDRATSGKTLRVSTGVIAPKLVHSVDVPFVSGSVAYTGPRRIVVGMVVGTDGTPSDLKIVQSAGAVLDKSVLQAVSQYRFTPGTVSDQPTAFPLNLEITLVGAR